MGFRKDTFATVWGEPRRVSDTMTRCRISINRKDKQSGEYVQEFGGFVAFIGTACAKKALRLKERDRIKLGDVDVTNRYDKAAAKEYTNFNCYSFELDGEQSGSGSGGGRAPARSVDEGYSDSDLPF